MLAATISAIPAARPSVAAARPGRATVVVRAQQSADSSRRAVLLSGAGLLAGLMAQPQQARAFGFPGGGGGKQAPMSDYDKMMAEINARNAATGESTKSAYEAYSPCPEGYEYLVKKSNPSAKCVEIESSIIPELGEDGAPAKKAPPVPVAPPSLEDVFSGKADGGNFEFVEVEGYKSVFAQ